MAETSTAISAEGRVIDMTIDEAIQQARYVEDEHSDCWRNCENTEKCCKECEYEHKQLANWLEELKVLKENSISKEAFEKMKSKSYQYGYRKGHGDAINKVLKLPKYTIYDTSNEFMNIRIDAISIEDILKLKEQNK